jgi:hypothetical protein
VHEHGGVIVQKPCIHLDILAQVEDETGHPVLLLLTSFGYRIETCRTKIPENKAYLLDCWLIALLFFVEYKKYNLAIALNLYLVVSVMTIINEPLELGT